MDSRRPLCFAVTVIAVWSSVFYTQAMEETCSLEDIKVCFLPVRASGLTNWLSVEGLQRLCPLIQQAFDCVDETCAFDDNWEDMEKVSYGIRNLENRICNDTAFRLGFLQHGNCFRGASLKFKDCIVAFNHTELLAAGCCENLGLVTCYEAILIPECPDATDFIEEMISVVKEQTYSFCQERNLVEDCPSFPETLDEDDMSTTSQPQQYESTTSQQETSTTNLSTMTSPMTSPLPDQPNSTTESSIVEQTSPIVDRIDVDVSSSDDIDPLLLDQPTSFNEPPMVEKPLAEVDPLLSDQLPSTGSPSDETSTRIMEFTDDVSTAEIPSDFDHETFDINDE